MSYHDIGRHVTGVPLALAEVGPVQGNSKLFLRLHGAFMLTAWIGTASLGILLARYFRQTWVGSQLCGKDQWFAVGHDKAFNHQRLTHSLNFNSGTGS